MSEGMETYRRLASRAAQQHRPDRQHRQQVQGPELQLLHLEPNAVARLNQLLAFKFLNRHEMVS